MLPSRILCGVDFLPYSKTALVEAVVLADQLRASLLITHVEVSSKLLEGVPWEALVEVARDDREIGWIVIGSHGRTGIERVLMGSVAERVVRHAPCSVVVARARRES